MYLQLKNLCKYLQNYENISFHPHYYYNEYQQYKQFKNDPSKLFYSQKLKCKVTIICGSTLEENFLAKLTEVIHQNNFSDFKQQLQKHKLQHEIKYYSSSVYIPNKSNISYIELILQSLRFNIDKFENSSLQYDPNDINQQLYSRKFLAYQQFIQLQIKNNSQNNISHIHEFIRFLGTQIDQLISPQYGPKLVLYNPVMPILGYFVDPLFASTLTYLLEEQAQSITNKQTDDYNSPKIVYINLNGIQNPLNLQTFKNFRPNGLLYITIYSENCNQYENNEQQDLNDILSKKLIENIGQINKLNEQANKPNKINSPQVLAFPLNSKCVIQNYQSQNSHNFLTGTSQDIIFLFDNIIYQQIRNFVPDAIVISYNSKLYIKQEHFKEIIKQLTILSDHKILFYPHLPDLQDLPTLQCNLFHCDLMTCQQYFYQQKKQLQTINILNMCDNFSIFMKVSSGAYDLKNSSQQTDKYRRYESGIRYAYLQSLQALEQFKYYKKYTSETIKGSVLTKLIRRQAQMCIKANLFSAKHLVNLFNTAISDLLNTEIQKNLEIKYKLAHLKLKGQYFLQQLLQIRKQKFLVKKIKEEKIQKAYWVKIDHDKNQILHSYSFKNKLKEQIYLEPYSQVIFQSQEFILTAIILNYRNQQHQLEFLIGRTPINQSEIVMSTVQTLSISNYCEYISYSFCFYRNTLYLFWPFQWNPISQIHHLLLNLHYSPKIVHKVLKFEIQAPSNLDIISLNLQQLKIGSQTDVIPRHAPASWAINSNTIYVFGGIYSSQQDYSIINTNISVISLNQKNFIVENIPKTKISSNLRPKMHYKIKKKARQNTLIISGGFGLQFTNFFSLFSYHQYQFNLENNILKCKTIPLTLNQIPIPILINKNSKKNFKDKNTDQTSKNSTYKLIIGKQVNKNCSVDKFYTKKNNIQQKKLSAILQSMSGIEDLYKRGMHWEEVYMSTTNQKAVPIELFLQVINEENQLMMKEYLMGDDSIISCCVDDLNENIYLLVMSPIYTNSYHIIYHQSLTNINDILHSKQLRMKKYFQFPSQISTLHDKTIKCTSDKIIIVGGRPNPHRYDYFIQTIKGILRLYTIKLTSTQPNTLIINSPYVVEYSVDKYCMYAVEYGLNAEIFLKIEIFSLEEKQRFVIKNLMNFNVVLENKIYRIDLRKCDLQICQISKYIRCSYQKLRVKCIILHKKWQQKCHFKYQTLAKVISMLATTSQQLLNNQLNSIYQEFKNIYSSQQDQESYLIWQIFNLLVNYIIQQLIKPPPGVDLYRLLSIDINCPHRMFISIGPILTTNIIFLQVVTPTPLLLTFSTNALNYSFGVDYLGNQINVIFFADHQQLAGKILYENNAQMFSEQMSQLISVSQIKHSSI